MRADRPGLLSSGVPWIRGKGASAGGVIVRVEAFDGNKTEQQPYGQLLFTYRTTAEISEGHNTKDFNITGKEAKKPAPPKDPPP